MTVSDGWFEGKAVVVTGAGGGIGAAIAEGFAAAGAVVGCADIDGRTAETTASSIRQRGGRAWSACCDASDPDQVEDLLGRACEHSSVVATLVANAGGSRGESVPFLEMDFSTWKSMIDRNLTTAFVSSQAFARHMAANDGGTVVVVSSQLSVVVRAGMAHYVAAKGAITQLVKGMAVDLAPYGIRVNALAPGPTLTPGNRAFFSRAEVESAHKASIPLGRVAEPEEMVGAALYLAGPHSSYTTGATLLVDGGYTIV